MTITTIARKDLIKKEFEGRVDLNVHVMVNGQPVVGDSFTVVTIPHNNAITNDQIKKAAYEAISKVADRHVDYMINRHFIEEEGCYGLIVKFNDIAADDTVRDDFSVMALDPNTKVPGTDFTYAQLKDIL